MKILLFALVPVLGLVLVSVVMFETDRAASHIGDLLR